MALLLGVSLALVLGNFKYVTYVSRENRDLQAYVTPVFALASARKLYRKLHPKAPPAFERVEDARRIPTRVPTIGVLVVGETARADHFQLNGYARPTNPRLSARPDVVSFTDASSCGTSTAYSVPCMFAFLGREDYSPEKAASQSNSLDLLQQTGVDVFWIDNNSGCKGVCARLPEGHYESVGEVYDESLLPALDARLALARQTGRDALIVLHMLGSHGPSYYKRYPESFAIFRPFCANGAPHSCDLGEIANAYDNTILYTDYVLDQVIARLESLGGPGFMLYASDHGESLGENGIYLHGLPYAVAPAAQTHVPVIFWGSSGIPGGGAPRRDELARHAVSHDHLSHTLLGAFRVQTRVYRPELDITGLLGFAPAL
jgi:lipid A ethanolaminephosphotransferase